MRTPTTTQAPAPTMGECRFLTQTSTGQDEIPHNSQALTPCTYSAVRFRNCFFPFRTLEEHHVSDQQHQVSSFTLPTYCDSSLMTPQSPTMAGNSEHIMPATRDHKLSPSTMSPPYDFLASHDDYRNDSAPMKHKSPSGHHLSSVDCFFPESPYCPAPDFRSYGVSATPASGRSDSSPGFNPSPRPLNSPSQRLGGYSNFHQTSTPGKVPGHRGRSQVPTLIAPNPLTLRPSTIKQELGVDRQKTGPSTSSTLGSGTTAQKPFPDVSVSLPPRAKKRKSTTRNPRERELVLKHDEMTEDEEHLIEIQVMREQSWRATAAEYNEITGKNMNVAALQMKKNRLYKRVRVWTETDTEALQKAMKLLERKQWEIIQESMIEFGCIAKWPKDRIEHEWKAMHPEWSHWNHYAKTLKPESSHGWEHDEASFSDGRASECHSLHDVDSGVQMSTFSTASMDGVRSRAASDASSELLHMGNQHDQADMMFDQQPESSWVGES